MLNRFINWKFIYESEIKYFNAYVEWFKYRNVILSLNYDTLFNIQVIVFEKKWWANQQKHTIITYEPVIGDWMYMLDRIKETYEI